MSDLHRALAHAIRDDMDFRQAVFELGGRAMHVNHLSVIAGQVAASQLSKVLERAMVELMEPREPQPATALGELILEGVSDSPTQPPGN